MDSEKKVTCSECKAKFKLEEQVEEGDLVFCPECDVELEVYSLEPPRVVLMDDEDYYEDEFEDDEEGFGFDDEEDNF
jgi:lysine biosynthesis protein LysW